jgi:hypothetical protein
MRLARLSEILFTLTALVSLGCGGETDASSPTDPLKEQQKKDLDACGLPSPCPSATATFDVQPTGARICMLQALAAGEAAHLSLVGVPDGGGSCSSAIEVYALGDGTAFVWRRTDIDCSDDPAAVDYKYDLDRCGLKDAMYLNECMDGSGPEGFPCHTRWFKDCVPAEPACS